MQFLRNIGATLLFITIYLSSWLLLLILQRISSVWPQFTRIKTSLEKMLMWDQSIGLLNSQFTPLMLSSIVNLYDMRYNGIKVVAISAYFSIIVIIATMVSVIALLIRLWKLASNLNQESIQEFNKKFSQLISDLRETSSNRLVLFWKAINLFRWLLTLIILTTLNSYPILQIQTLLIFSVIQQLLILKCLPYDSTLTNVTVFINEVSVSIHLYLSLLLSDYLECQFTSDDDFLKAKVGLSWALALLLCVVIGINVIALLIKKLMQFTAWQNRMKRKQTAS